MSAKSAKFDCGCIIPTDKNGKIDFSLEIDNLNLNCKKTWDLIGEGNCCGVFQLESQLGRTYAKKLKPDSINELADLIALLRPACLQSIMENGKSITDNYILRKWGKEEETIFDPSIKDILAPTHGLMCFQEQAMQIVQKTANFTEVEADYLRSACGKKKADEMAKIKTLYLEKAKEAKVLTEDKTELLFNWIEASQRYAFNFSHSVSYSLLSYLSAYTKCHFPLEFFCSYLSLAKEKIKPKQEISNLINNCREMDIEVKPPDLRHLNSEFSIIDNKIYFGLVDIKAVGQSTIKKFPQLLKDNWQQLSWPHFILSFLLKINSTAAKALISSGALPWFNLSRNRMLYEYGIVGEFTKKELDFLEATVYDGVEGMLKVLLEAPIGQKGGMANKKRYDVVLSLARSLEAPPYSLEDSIEWTANIEETLLGIALTCSKISGLDTFEANSTCLEFKQGQGSKPIIACEIKQVREHIIKKGKSSGKTMAFLEVGDDTGILQSVVVFPTVYKEVIGLLNKGNTLMIKGERDKSGDSLIVKSIKQI